MIKNILWISMSMFLLATVAKKDEKIKEEPAAERLEVNPDILPLQIADEYFHPLRTLVDSNLQQTIQVHLNSNPKWKQLLSQKAMAVGLVDMRDPYKIRFASVNGNEMMYAASLPKIAILLTAMDALEKKELEITPTINKDFNAMIRRSDNQASTRMIDRLGYEKIEQVLTDPSYELYDDDFGGRLCVSSVHSVSKINFVQ